MYHWKKHTKRPSPATILKRKRKLSTTSLLLAKKDGKYDSTNPFFEDSAAQLAKDFRDNPKGLEQHFIEKKDSINSLKDPEETGELEDISQDELNRWEAQRLELLRVNEDVKEYTYDRIESGMETSSSSVSESDSDMQVEASQEEASHTTSSEQQGSSHFPQDSSDVTQTDFSSFDPFDE